MINVPDVVVVVSAFVLAALLLWVVLIEVPKLATRTLQIEGERIRNGVLDAYQDGKIDRTEPGLEAFLRFCHIVASHTTELRLGRVLALQIALEHHGLNDHTPVEVDSQVQEEAAEPTLLERYEHELDELVGDYLINGSRAWWVLWPARNVWRAARRLIPHQTPHETSAYQLAVELREEIADESVKSAAVREMITQVERHRPDRILAPAA